MVRVTLKDALPPPEAVLRPRALSRSALPVTLRSAPVELRSVTLLAVVVPTSDGVAPALVLMVAAPALMVATLTPLARSIAVARSPTVAAGVPLVPR
ncbi:hypothetical protein ACVWXL_004462 [Bradyrhizobium sp. GM22.5]